MKGFNKSVVKAWHKMVKSIHWGLLWPCKVVFRRFVPIDRSMIVFMTKRGYGCNPKYIYRELRRRKLPYRMVWLVTQKSQRDGYPAPCQCVPLRSLRGVYYASKARLWIDNGVNFSVHFEKRPGQLHAQTMHGSLGIKKLDNAIKSREQGGWRGRTIMRREMENTDVLFSNSKFEEDVFRGVFWRDTPMLRLGHARTDILFSKDADRVASLRRGLKKRYNVPLKAKIALYAPTYRKGGALDLLVCSNCQAICEALGRRFGGDFVLLVRFHQMTHGVKLGKKNRKIMFNATDYPDMQELLLVSDVGITDYSSWIFDYVLTRRPGFLVAPDADSYETSTGLCYPLSETPFPVAKDVEELLSEISAFDDAKFAARAEEFLRGKQCTDDGHASERIADWIVSAMSAQ